MCGEEGDSIELLALSTRHMREKCNTTIEVHYNAINILLMTFPIAATTADPSVL